LKPNQTEFTMLFIFTADRQSGRFTLRYFYVYSSTILSSLDHLNMLHSLHSKIDG